MEFSKEKIKPFKKSLRYRYITIELRFTLNWLTVVTVIKLCPWQQQSIGDRNSVGVLTPQNVKLVKNVQTLKNINKLFCFVSSFGRARMIRKIVNPVDQRGPHSVHLAQKKLLSAALVGAYHLCIWGRITHCICY